jgi:hypothetical protein
MSAAAAGTDDASYVSVNESFGAFANLMNGQQSVCKMDDFPREALIAYALSTGALSEVVYVKATQLDGKTIAVFPAKNSTLGTVKKLVAESSGIAVAAQSFLDTDGATGGDCDDKALADDAVIGVSCTLTLVVDDTTLPFAWDSAAELLQGDDSVCQLLVPIMVMPEENCAPDTVHTVSFRVSRRVGTAGRDHVLVCLGLARVSQSQFGADAVGLKIMWCLHETPMHDVVRNDNVCGIPHGTTYTLMFDPIKGTLNSLHEGVLRESGRNVSTFCVPGQQLQWVVSVRDPNVVVEIVPNVCNVTA